MDPAFAANLDPREFAAFYTMGKMAAFMSRDCESQILSYGNCLQQCVEENMVGEEKKKKKKKKKKEEKKKLHPIDK